jgi:hypothetical protein
MKRTVAVFVIVFFWLSAAIGVASDKKLKRKPVCVSPQTVEKYLSAKNPSKLSAKSVSETIVTSSGDVVVVEADSQLLIFSNPFDLHGKGVTFEPVLRNRYSYTSGNAHFDSDASDPLTIEDDDSVEFILTDFEFPFAGNRYKQLFVNSNGNITFDTGDPEAPNLENLMNGPPRIAAFFADLDPETAGSVVVRQTKDFATITWFKVPEFFSHDQFAYGENTFQIILYPTGRIDLVYSRELSAKQGLIGIVPGYGKSTLRFVDFSRSRLKGRPAASFIEDFRDYESIDIPNLMKSVYGQIPDHFDFVSLFSNFNLTPVPEVQAFAINVQNDVRGIGNPSANGSSIFRDQKKYGSNEKLQNITFFGNIHDYPSRPGETIPDTYTSLLQVLGHEVGHRWLAYAEVDRDGRAQDILLGRDKSHWSFFFDTDGSLVEGNQITDRGSSFVTSMPFQGYSRLDLYLMGFLKPEDVGDTFIVEGAHRFSPDFPFAPESSPEPDVSFQGSAHSVKIDDIISANGKREPDSSTSQKTFRHLFVLIVKKENPSTQDELAAVDQLRREWESFFGKATLGLGKIDTQIAD